MTTIELFEKGLMPVEPGNPYFSGLINFKSRTLSLAKLDRVKGLCKWCYKRSTIGRAHYCGKACQDSAQMFCYPQSSGYEFIKWRQKGLCARCSYDFKTKIKKRHDGTDDQGEIDHVKPIYQGGFPLGWNNHQLLCGECHRIKTSEDRKNEKTSASR